MTKLEDIERAIAQLPAEELAKFRVWFEQFDAMVFDAKIDRDVKSGRLDELAEQALKELRTGRAREL